ncbi:MAG TPA: hypothetical protein VJ911_03275, partial [Cryomorphaceae bacterium]|nr:hypothetical protein [Cryomorphaceae bacterium]
MKNKIFNSIIRNLSIGIIYLLGLINHSLGQNLSGEGICVSVESQVNIRTSWVEADGMPADGYYTLFRTNEDPAGFYDDITIIDVGDPLDWLDIPATPDTGPVYYYVQGFNASNQLLFTSDTVSSLFLELGALAGTLNSVAQLEWNSPFLNGPGNGQFNIYRLVDGEATETLIESVPANQTTYLDTLYGFCVASDEELISIQYRVAYENVNCEMFSQSRSDSFQDLLGPQPPQVETVLIDPLTGDAIIYWYPVSDPDLEQYLVQQIPNPNNPAVAINVGFVPAGESEFLYEDASPSAPNNLVVIAFDDCGNDLSYEEIYTTMFLKSDYTECEQSVTLSWNPYEGWEEGVDSYNLYVDDGLGSEVIQVSAEEESYELEITPNLEYCVYLEAVSSGTQRASTSNMACFTTTYPAVVDYAYLSSVSTVDNTNIRVNLLQDSTGSGTTYDLYRKREGSEFQKIATLNQSTSELISYTDTDVDPQNTIYTYKFRVFDGCGQELFETNTGKNIVLRARKGTQELENIVEWNAYGEWEEAVLEYRLLRKLGSEMAYSEHQIFGNGVQSYRENVEDFMQDEGE